MPDRPDRLWGTHPGSDRSRRVLPWLDPLIVGGIVGVLYGLLSLGRHWSEVLLPSVTIDLSIAALPGYTLYSLSRGLIAYALSLAFTFVFAFWAARDRQAERLLLPMLDVLQSIPVLGFMPGLVLAFVGLFPHANAGLELAAITMIFTGQVWNLTFSLFQSLKSVPPELREVATIYRFGPRRTMRRLEVPFAATGLVWNSMMSMAGGWFFLMINESFVLGDRDFRLPGLGSYMSVAVARGDATAMVGALVAMTTLIVALDQLVWRPVVVWAQKFRVEEGGGQEAMNSWALDLLRRSRLVAWLGEIREARAMRRQAAVAAAASRPAVAEDASGGAGRGFGRAALVALVVLLGYGGVHLVEVVHSLGLRVWAETLGAGGLTLLRVLAATAIGTAWALPAGLAIGLSPRVSRVMQPVVQVVASFPAPMLFPLAVAGLQSLGVSLGFGSILLMLLGTQWYILFNVIAGAMAVPGDLREAARSYGFGRWQTFRRVHAPAVFPFLVTGWVTAAGGAWNASIVSEYVAYRGDTLVAPGLGAQISRAAEAADFPRLAAGVMVMSVIVVTFNRLVWRRCYALAERRFSLGR
jgi:NitT/TauT family transport system permease protein